jgi:hypothetical protein
MRSSLSVKLPGQLICQWSPQPLRKWTWTPPLVPDFAGPDDLAKLLRSYRTRLEEIQAEGGRPDAKLGDLPDSALERLLTVAYRASFLTEESRPVRACLYAPPRWESVAESLDLPVALHGRGEFFARDARGKQEAVTNTYRLAKALPLDDPKHIARFAPTLAAEDAVLVVREKDGQVLCDGITLLDSGGAEHDLLHMPRRWGGGGGLFVHILGPGELRVVEGRLGYTLRANVVRVHRPAEFTKPVSRWHEELARKLVETCSGMPGWDAKHIGGSADMEAKVDYMILWSRILWEAVWMRHGGTFVVVPDVRAAPVRVKYRLQPFDLSGKLREVWLSLCRVRVNIESGDADRTLELFEAKRRRTHRLCSAVRSVGHLSGTDGCVVLDRGLIVHGFGGSIQASDLPAGRCVRIAGEAQEEVTEEILLQPFGERHRSAYKLCRQVPDSLAFVISQDGDLRLFASDESAVYLYDLLHP